MKNVTVAVPDDVYRRARVCAAQRDTSVSSLVAAYLARLSDTDAEFERLAALQHDTVAQIRRFSAGDRQSRDEVHDRAIR